MISFLVIEGTCNSSGNNIYTQGPKYQFSFQLKRAKVVDY